jgi:hypothetical protein
MTPTPDPAIRTPVDNVRLLQKGLSQSAVLELLGQPAEVLAPEKGDAFDTAWLYVHDRRGKFKLKYALSTFVGFRKGVVIGHWQTRKDFPPET